MLGLCNIGLFFPLIFITAYHLPGGLAATLQATSPLAVMAIAWPAIGERPEARRVLAAAVGFVLVKRWPTPVEDGVDMLTSVSWQLTWGGLFLVPLALLVEGPPPALTGTNLLGLAWLTTMGTAVAYVCWFRGLAAMPAGAVSLVGLLNPVVGTVLGVLVMHEALGALQALGMLLVLGGLGGVVAGQRRTPAPPAAPVLVRCPATPAALTVELTASTRT